MRRDIGERLKEERIRLGYNQLDFAAIGGATKNSQLNWEQGKQAPNAEFLALVGAIGVDVRYVLLGKLAENALPDDENGLLTDYRKLDRDNRARLLGIIEGMIAISGG